MKRTAMRDTVFSSTFDRTDACNPEPACLALNDSILRGMGYMDDPNLNYQHLYATEH